MVIVSHRMTLSVSGALKILCSTEYWYLLSHNLIISKTDRKFCNINNHEVADTNNEKYNTSMVSKVTLRALISCEMCSKVHTS